MENIICNVTEEDILKVELYCNLEKDSENSLLDDIKNNQAMYTGKTKILMDCYFVIISLLKGQDKNLNLECIKIMTTDYDLYQIFSEDMRKNRITISDNFIKLMLNVTNYLAKREKLSIKVLDYHTFEYEDYDNLNEKLTRKGK